MNLSNKTLYKTSSGRRRFFNLIFMLPLRKMLLKISQNHLASGKKQIVFPAFDYISNEIALEGVFEKRELDTFFNWLISLNVRMDNSVAIDIGANIGNHSLYFSDYYQKVYSFEPSKTTFKILSLNSELATNIKCFNFGCSDKGSSAFLSSSSTNTGGNSVISENEEGISEEIELRTLDQTLPDIDKVGLLKVDVEGHEFQALKGARRTIMRNMPIILFEQHESDFCNNKSITIELLKEYGYEKFAYLQKIPRVKGSFLKKILLNPVLVLVLGDTTKIQLSSKIDPGFYEFIIALPSWFPSSIKKDK